MQGCTSSFGIVQIRNDLKVLLEQVCVPLVEHDSSELPHKLNLFFMDDSRNIRTQGRICAAKLHELILFNRVARRVLPVGSQTVLVSLLSVKDFSVAIDEALASNRDDDVFVTVDTRAFQSVQ